MQVWDFFKIADHSWHQKVPASDADSRVALFDMRPFEDESFHELQPPIDLSLINGHDGDLESLSRLFGVTSAKELEEAKDQLLAHSNAIRGARIASAGRSILDLVPAEFFEKYKLARLKCINQLASLVGTEAYRDYAGYTWPTMLALRQLEKNQVKLDVENARKLGDPKRSGNDASFVRHMLGVVDENGFMRQRLTPVGSKTWRLRSVSGLRSMSIPHGECRELIVSRYPGGSIGSIDFNAIDFRCLVQAAGVRFYDGQRDFHSRTASLVGPVTPDLRDKIKKFTYTDLYGSSVATLQKQVQLPMRDIDQIFEKLAPVFDPIRRFRHELVEECRQRKFLSVTDPFTGFRAHSEITGDMHSGQIVGLWAQTRSSFVFSHALRKAVSYCRLTKEMTPIFTVHDELNVDVGQESRLERLAQMIETETGFAVKVKQGKNYSEATS